MSRRNLIVSVLDEVEMLNQEITLPRPIAEQKLNLFSRLRINLTSFRGRFGALATLARVLEWLNCLDAMAHSNVSFPVLRASDDTLWHLVCQELFQCLSSEQPIAVVPCNMKRSSDGRPARPAHQA